MSQNPNKPNRVTAHIETLSHDARGIARIDGKVTFIPGCLPGETVSFEYTRRKRDFDEGRLVTILEASPKRVSPRCPHYEMCGGCSLQHLDSNAQLDAKQQLLKELLERIGHVQPDTWLQPLTSEPWHYRNKARLSVRYVEKKQATLVGFREKNNPRYITEITQCPILHARVDEHLLPLRHVLDALDDPKSIAQVEVAAGDTEVALILRTVLPLSDRDKQTIQRFADQAGFRIFLQPGGPDTVSLWYPDDSKDYLEYALLEDTIHIRFFPTDFTQINPHLNRRMVQYALDLLALEPNDTVLDLFCGLGNFSLPIAQHCTKVLGIEGSHVMVERAKENASRNGLLNTDFMCANLEEATVLDALQAETFSKVLLDPPRSGALAIVKELHIINPDRVVYVSCNPATLARDADVLVHQQGLRLVAAGVMDMFPHTAHVESIALFEKG